MECLNEIQSSRLLDSSMSLVKENVMLQSAIILNYEEEEWDRKKLNDSISNVVSYLKRKHFNRVEIRLFEPYFKESRHITSESDIRKFQEFLKDISENSDGIIQYVMSQLKQAMPDKSKMFGQVRIDHSRKIFMDKWVESVGHMFTGINSEIKDGVKEKVHVIYLFKHKSMAKTDYPEHISFVNYIVY
jgi:hypothetical protein